MAFLIAYKRWLIGATVIVALGSLIWFAGPVLAKPLVRTDIRATLILLVVLGWIAIEAIRAWRERRADNLMASDLQKNLQEEADARDEAAAVARRMKEAIDFYKTRTKRGRWGRNKYLYQLPFYVFIGAPGAGKTTAVLSSGLRFAMTATGAAESTSAEVMGSGGTKDCVWLFGEDAVLIDTAGRFLTQDSNSAIDRAGWESFLRLLKEHRPLQPINGIIVTISVEELLRASADKRALHSQQVAARVEELQRQFGMQFPVYVMVSKCDLLPGFAECFGAMDTEQASQIWGCTFDLGAKRGVDSSTKVQFDTQFATLVERLNRFLIQRLHQERNDDKRKVMYSFPQQFAALKPSVAEFLDRAFDQSRYRLPVMVRGIYFTSGTQDGTSIDQFLAGVAASLSLPGGTRRAQLVSNTGKAFFVERLMQDVVFREAGLAGHSEARDRRIRTLGWSLTACTVLTGVLLLIAWMISYDRNKVGLAKATERTGAAAAALAGLNQPSTRDFGEMLTALDRVRRVPLALYEPATEPSFWMGFGLYQGRALASNVDDRYRELLRAGLFPRVALLLEQEMKNAASEVRRYDALKAYLMLYSRPNAKMDSAWFVDAVKRLLSDARIVTAPESAEAHLLRLVTFQEGPLSDYRPFNKAVVDDTTETLRSKSPLLLAFDYLRETQVKTEGIRLETVLATADGVLVGRTRPLSTPLQRIYSAQAYREEIKPAVTRIANRLVQEEAWVLGLAQPRQRSPELAQALHRRYLENYAKEWRDSLEDVVLRVRADGPLNNRLDMAIRAAQTLASQPALTNLVKKVSEETRLYVVVKDAPIDEFRDDELKMESAFESFRKLAGEGKTSLNETALADLKTIAIKLSTMRDTLASGGNVEQLAEDLAALGRTVELALYPKPIEGIVKSLLSVGREVATRGVKKGVVESVSDAVASCSLLKVTERYPFRREEPRDVSLDAFDQIFKSGGEIDSVLNGKLKDHIDRTNPMKWKPKAAGGIGEPAVSAATVEQFQRADRIRRAFIGNEPKAKVVVDLSIVSGNEDLTLEYGGSTQVLLPGRGVRLTWPGQMPGLRVRAGKSLLDNQEGEWALFRFVDRARLKDTAPEDSPVRLLLKGSKGDIQIDVRTGSAAINPFRLPDLADFRCPR